MFGVRCLFTDITCTSRWCHSELLRDLDIAIIRFIKWIACRPTAVGARTLAFGASAGPESHGQYLPDSIISPTVGLMKGKDGEELQKRVWAELSKKLETIRPGVTNLA